jgi:hypothetical protein
MLPLRVAVFIHAQRQGLAREPQFGVILTPVDCSAFRPSGTGNRGRGSRLQFATTGEWPLSAVWSVLGSRVQLAEGGSEDSL